MNQISKALLIIFCFLCRFGFEFGSVAMIWVFLPFRWAVVLTYIFVIWQIAGFFLLKEMEKSKDNSNKMLKELQEKYEQLRVNGEKHIVAAMQGQVIDGCKCGQCRRIAMENEAAQRGEY